MTTGPPNENENEKEDLFEFDSSGEAVRYVSKIEARLIAIRHAREDTEIYGPSFNGVNLVWELTSEEDDDDYYQIRLSWRPAGNFDGDPGIEEFYIDKVGKIELRQLLSVPTGGDINLLAETASPPAAPVQTVRPEEGPPPEPVPDGVRTEKTPARDVALESGGFCASCGHERQGARRFCEVCAQFFAAPAGVRAAGMGQRFLALLVDLALIWPTLFIGYLIWWLIVLDRGQTPGKQLLRIWVVGQGGEQTRWGRTFVREGLVKGLLFSVLIYFTLGIAPLLNYLWPLWDKNNQALHDKIARTYVVQGPRAQT